MRIALGDMASQAAETALREGLGFARLAPWTIWRVTGADRASFFHAFCTAELKKQASGEGCEAFVTTGQGKILDFVFFTPLGDVLWMDAFGDRHDAWHAHFDRYRFMEKAKWENVTEETTALYLSSDAAFEALGIPSDAEGAAAYSARSATFDDVELVVRRVTWLGRPGWTVFVPQSVESVVIGRLTSNGFVEASMERWHRRRALAGTPLAGVDLSEKNLPQEVDRDAAAISYTKGCYLGQETIARLEAMGHVNWLLALVEGPLPPGDSGDELKREGKVVARLGTIVDQGAASSALAFVRREFAADGGELPTDAGTFRVKRFGTPTN